MADIPGIIEGAHTGKGLGVRFLRHIERNSVLLFLVPCDANDIVKEYKILVNELKLYNPELLEKKRILGISKCDMMDDELIKELQKEMLSKAKSAFGGKKEKKIPVIYFSSHTQIGLVELKDKLWYAINNTDD